MNLATALLWLPGLVLAITVHEFAHAWSASRLGDDFPRRQGRVSLNPLRHLAPLGTLAILVLPFGWGRPVLLNLYNFRRPKRDYLISSVAGPFANLLVLAACVGLMHLTRRSYVLGQAGEVPMMILHVVLMGVGLINAVLATVNLIPLPPLDGSKIWPVLIPGLKPGFGRGVQRISLMVLLFLVFTGSLRPLINGAVETVFSIMPGADALIFEDRWNAAREAADQGNDAEAERLWTDALAINPHSHAAWHQRAIARMNLDKWAAALDDVNRAIELDNTVRDYHHTRTLILDHLNRATHPATQPRGREGISH